MKSWEILTSYGRTGLGLDVKGPSDRFSGSDRSPFVGRRTRPPSGQSPVESRWTRVCFTSYLGEAKGPIIRSVDV